MAVAVISDVHAYAGKDIKPDDAPSHCCITENDPTKNPLAGLVDFIGRAKLRADVLLCAGDIGDKAQTIAVQHVWRELHKIKSLLRAPVLVATTGNHDVDSRHHNEYDAKGMLQALTPAYPLGNSRMNDRYWSRHFEVIARDHYRILVLNSSAFHGEGRYKELKRFEYEQGRVSEHTLRTIETRLAAGPSPPINILLCHHHPHDHSELGLGEDDLMIGGRALLRVLDSGKYGRWLVIHGHKHHPKLENAQGSASPPIIFAAGSLAAYLPGRLQTVCRNQFYLITFPYRQFDDLGFVGLFSAWDWHSGHGWKLAGAGSDLPATGGFGWRGDFDQLAKKVADAVKRTGNRWAEVVANLPELDYLLPQDLRRLVQLLGSNHDLVVEPPDGVPPTWIGKQK